MQWKRLFAVALCAVAAIAYGGDAKAAKDDNSGHGLKFRMLMKEEHEKPDAQMYRKVELTFGSKSQPRGQFVDGSWKLRDKKTGAVDQTATQQVMALLKVNTFAEDVKGTGKENKGKVITKAGTYVNIGLPYFDSDERKKDEERQPRISWPDLVLNPRTAIPTNLAANTGYENEKVFRDDANVPTTKWIVLTLDGGREVIIIEPMDKVTVDKDDKKPEDKDQTKERKATAWLLRSAPLEDPVVPAAPTVKK